MDSLAVTDHGNMHAAWSFYEEAKAQKIRPILGFEAYLAFGPRQAREKPPWAPAAYSHLVLLARNRAGYKNLVRLTSIGFTEGFYRRPADRQGRARRALPRASSAWRRASRARWRCTSGRASTTRRRRAPSGSRARSARTGSGSRSSSTASPRSGWSPKGCSGWARSWASAWSPPTTRTISGGRTPRRTTCCSPSAPAATSTTPSASASPGRNRTSSPRRRCGRSSRTSPEALANTAAGRRPLRVRLREEVLPARLPPPRRIRQRRSAARAPRARGRGAPLRRAAAAPRSQERLDYELGVINKAGYAGYFLIVAGLHRGGARPRHPGGPGPRLGGRLDRRVRARHHRRLPAQVRPAVRALPESRARVDARHRRRLLLRAPRRGDRVRAREVRARQRRPDRHLRDDEVARRGQGRRPACSASRPARPTRSRS